MARRDAELARRAFEAWEEGTLREYAERHVHPDLEFHDAPEMPDAQVVRGREAALARMDSYMEQLGRFSIPVCEVEDRSEGVFVRVAPSGRAPASGVSDRLGGLLRDALSRRADGRVAQLLRPRHGARHGRR